MAPIRKSGRTITIQFRDAPHEIVYTARGNDPDALIWWFGDAPADKVITDAELADIEARCLTDLRERRTQWRARLLRQRLVPDLRRR